MLNPVDYIEKYSERTTRILGINYQQWKKLVEKASAYERQQPKKWALKKVRINAPGGGRKPIFNQEEIGLCLFYLRIDVMVGERGPEADKNLLTQQQAKFDSSQRFVGDKAYIGAPRTVTLRKKPKG